MKRIPFQDLKHTNSEDMEAYVEAATDVLRSGRYLHGERVRRFESLLAESCGARHCIAVSNGLDALRLIFSAYITLGRLKKGDEVIIPANTFIATFLAVTSCGLNAVACDVSEKDFCIDFSRIPLTPCTRAIVPVHLYGNPCWNREFFDMAREKGILVVEDNAQAIGAESAEEGFHGSFLTGHLGDAAAISFYPAKNIGAFGDAGAVLTDDDELASTVRMLSNYGSREKYVHEAAGFNCRMDELQAALLTLKLEKMDAVNLRRRQCAALYDSLIQNPGIVKPRIYPDRRQVWHQYVVRTDRRDRLRSFLEEKGVATEIHYPVPCHLQNCYRGSDSLIVPSPLPEAERLAGEILSLPIANVSDEEIRYIADIINEF